VPTIREPGVPRPLASALERAFCALSAARRRRIFHPEGMAFRGTMAVAAPVRGVPLFETAAAHDVLIRFSRALGTPRGRPDFLGLALRIADAQDLLLASSTSAAALRYLPVPARTFAGTTFSSLLPFDAGGRVALVGARVHHVRTAADDQLVELEAAVALAPVGVTLALARVGRRWRRIATVDVRERLPDVEAAGIAFDPWICAGGLVPWGPVSALRSPAYRGSRRGRAGLDAPLLAGTSTSARSAPRDAQSPG
jgi:hypothetical protein